MNQPNPGYSFELCSADDPKRTHFWCGVIACWWDLKNISHYPGGHERCGRRDVCGQFWRKPKEIPAEFGNEWRVVGENEEIKRDDKCWTSTSNFFGGHAWHGRTPADAIRECPRTQWLFIRRKSQPVSAVESGAGFGRWISVKERLPQVLEDVLAFDEAEECEVAYFTGTGWCHTPTNRVYSEITHWMPLPNPPAPEKTPAEKAWDSDSLNLIKEGASQKDCYLAGYAKGAAK